MIRRMGHRCGAIAWAVLAGAFALPVPARAADAAADTSTVTVISAARLLDPVSGEVRSDPLVIVRGTRIVSVGTRGRLKPPRGARRIELPGLTLLPGLIDAHIHLQLAGRPVSNALATLRAGFTTVADLGATNERILRLRDAIERGERAGPRVLAAGRWIGERGGICDFGGIGVQGPDSFAARVRENVAAGADLVKLCVSAWVEDAHRSPETYEIADEDLATAVAEAHRLGKLVVVHGISHGAVRAALAVGVDGFVHSCFADSAQGERMRRHQIPILPTAASFEPLLETEAGRALFANMRQRIAQGVPVVFGTDAGVLPHGSNAVEFLALQRLGLSPLETVRAATTRAAGFLGVEKLVGSLEPGKQADLIAVAGDPLVDLEVLQRVRFVMKGGAIVRHEREAGSTPSR